MINFIRFILFLPVFIFLLLLGMALEFVALYYTFGNDFIPAIAFIAAGFCFIGWAGKLIEEID